MNILTKLKTYKGYSANEQIIADYILEHPESIINMSAKQLADKCIVSVATIYRLCDKLEINGFSDLKVKISASLKEYVDHQEFDFDFPIKQNQTHYTIINKLKEDYEKTLQSTLNLFQLDQLHLIVSAMKRAKRIVIYTSSANVYFAQNFQFQMQEINIPVQVPIDEYQQRLAASSSDENQFAIIISFGGRGMAVKQLARILQERKAKTLLISSIDCVIDGFTPTYRLYMSDNENHYKKISSFSTRLTLLYILDVIYTCYFELDYNENIKKKLDYYSYISKQYD